MGDSGSPRMTTSLIFASPQGQMPPMYTETLSVPTMDDLANPTGEIIVTLVDDTGVKDYTLSDTTSERFRNCFNDSSTASSTNDLK